ncbi:YkgJ family cysteine cluster protein [Allosphingosinicella sp.]|jgi:Fe-S-cluster containining protein|uniref:YkgJ family cysteine cluster protein n=1 Tax=Allosphingosinicella sp. TaxID=2823234 RepID=UPI002EFC752B
MSRTERRRRTKEDLRFLERGFDCERPEAVQVMALMRVMSELIEESRAAGSIAPLMAFLHANMLAAGRAAPRRAIACRMGCAHCCRAWVSARAPEVLFAAAAVPRRELDAVRATLEATFQVTGALTVAERARLAAPCPMLLDNRCRIYEARPATCRNAVSADAQICARAFAPGAADEDIPAPDFYMRLGRGYSVALAGALKRGGFAACSYELNAALRLALARADCESAWLAGEDVFAGVPIDPGSDPFEFANNRRIYEAAWA